MHSGNGWDLHLLVDFNAGIPIREHTCTRLIVLLRATRETRETPLVEAGTSFSLSATRLALAVVQNAALCGEGGKVIATENESVKTDRARVHWEMLGDAFTPWAELREA
ncbi:hypothetical protein PMIN03_007454 [Paraphaeosphaeria minitans]